MQIILDDCALIVHEAKRSSMIVADLHLGFSAVIDNLTGVMIPSEHRGMMARLKSLIDRHSIDSLYLLGDLKHTITVDSPFNWDVVPEFVHDLSRITSVLMVPGNHDGDLSALLPRDVLLSDVRGYIITTAEGNLGLFHGHSWPSLDLLECKMIVMGHYHPSLRRVRGLSVPEIGRGDRRRSLGTIPVVLKGELDNNCMAHIMGVSNTIPVQRASLVILPSFNPLISGVAVNEPGLVFGGPVFEGHCASLSDFQVFSTGGVLLGSVSDFQENQRND